MTSRCRILMIMSVPGLIFGVLRQQPTLTLLAMSMLVWMLISAIIFYTRVVLCWRNLICDRTITHHEGSSVTTLWVDRDYQVSINIDSGNWRLPAIIHVGDLVPAAVGVIPQTGSMATSGKWLTADVDLTELTYRFKPLAAGSAFFAGLRFVFHEPQGLFVWERVYRQAKRYRVLPSFISAGDIRPVIKRTNALPQHGIHPLRRAGFGGDLLELREYQPGDPPKSIAWKISARREHLMTRQYESEVPVRLTIIRDNSPSLYVGRPGWRLVDQINYAAASIAKAAVSVGDSVGLVVAGDAGVRRYQPSPGDRAFYQVLELLADSTRTSEPPVGTFQPELLDLAAAICKHYYPEWLDDKINDSVFSLLPIRPRNRRRARDRYKVATVVAEYYQLDIDQTAAMRYDDRVLADRLRQFLADHDQPWVPPLVETSGFRPSDQQLIARGERLARQLSLSVAHAHDNEVYVIMAHLFDRVPGYLEPDRDDQESYPLLEQLMPAIKVAIGRHHRVVLLSPSVANDRVMNDKVAGGSTSDVLTSADVIRRAERIRMEHHRRHVSRRLRGLGANFALLGQPEVLPVVMSEAELAGTGRFTRRGQHQSGGRG